MQEIRHTADALSFIYGGPAGLLEFRIIGTKTEFFSVLVIHIPGCEAEGCDDDCDADFLPGDEIALAWRVAGFDDAAVWSELARHAVAVDLADVPQPPHEPSADARAFAAHARQVANEMAAEGYFQK